MFACKYLSEALFLKWLHFLETKKMEGWPPIQKLLLYGPRWIMVTWYQQRVNGGRKRSNIRTKISAGNHWQSQLHHFGYFPNCCGEIDQKWWRELLVNWPDIFSDRNYRFCVFRFWGWMNWRSKTKLCLLLYRFSFTLFETDDRNLLLTKKR